MKEQSNKAGNILRTIWTCEKRGPCLYFYAKVTRILFCCVRAIKLGAIVGPLFEAFMEGAVRDRLEDSEATYTCYNERTIRSSSS